MTSEHEWVIDDRTPILDQVESDNGVIEWVKKLRFEVRCPENHKAVVRTTFGEEVLEHTNAEGRIEVPCVECQENYPMELGPWPVDEI